MSQDFMCPVCNSAPLITDYCPNCSRIEGHTAPPDAFPQAHRLALELECLLLSCQDNAAVSKWWDSAHEALEQWRQFCAIEPAPQQQNQQSGSGEERQPSHCEGESSGKPAVGAARIAYMDATDFEHELGHCEVEVYPAAEDVFKFREYARECGVIKVKIERLAPEDLLPAAGGSPAVFCPDTPLRKEFETWVRGYAPIAEFTRNESGEYIVLGMQDNYLAFVAGATVSKMESAAPLPDDVRKLCSKLRDIYVPISESAADMIESLARRVADFESAYASRCFDNAELRARIAELEAKNAELLDKLTTAWQEVQTKHRWSVPEGMVLMPREPTEAIRKAGCVYLDDDLFIADGIYKAMIAAGEEK